MTSDTWTLDPTSGDEFVTTEGTRMRFIDGDWIDVHSCHTPEDQESVEAYRSFVSVLTTLHRAAFPLEWH